MKVDRVTLRLPKVYEKPGDGRWQYHALKTLGSGVFGGIEGKEEKFYGGDQGWFDEKWKQKGGCGPTAASNILAYLAASDLEKFGNLYAYSNLTQASFKKHMNEVAEYVKPGHLNDFTWGFWYVSDFAKQTKKFAVERGILLTAHTMTNVVNTKESSYADLRGFIWKALDNDKPVGMVVLLNNKIEKNYNNHWMTITEIENERKGQQRGISSLYLHGAATIS